MSHRQPRPKTTIPSKDQLGSTAATETLPFPANDHDQRHNRNQQAAEAERSKIQTDKPASLDLGSRWCPEEIEIFFSRKSFLIQLTLF